MVHHGAALAAPCPPSLVALEAQWSASRMGPVAGSVDREAAMAAADAARQRELATAFAWVDMERGYLAEVRAWKATFDVLSELPPGLVPKGDLRFLEIPFGAVRPFSYEEIHGALLPRFAVNDGGIYSNALPRDGLVAARGELAAAVEKGWDAVVARSNAAFATLEAALAR